MNGPSDSVSFSLGNLVNIVFLNHRLDDDFVRKVALVGVCGYRGGSGFSHNFVVERSLQKEVAGYLVVLV